MNRILLLMTVLSLVAGVIFVIHQTNQISLNSLIYSPAHETGEEHISQTSTLSTRKKCTTLPAENFTSTPKTETIQGGSRSGILSVYLNNKLVKPGGKITIKVDISDFFGVVEMEKEETYNSYFRLYNLSNHQKIVCETTTLSKKEKEAIYGKAEFVWEFNAPRNTGKYTYMVLRGNEYDSKLVWPEIIVSEEEGTESISSPGDFAKFTIKVGKP